MRLLRSAAVGALGLLLVSGSCAYHGTSIDSREYLQLHRAFSVIAPGWELRAFKRAARQGPDSLQTFLESFWSRRDPTPGTARNEYWDRFEARFAEGVEQFIPPGGDVIADDRLIAYLLYGNPMEEETAEDYVGWIYEPDPEVVLAGRDHPLLDKLVYAATFRRDSRLEHYLKLRSNFPWPRLPGVLTVAEIAELDSLLSNPENDRYLRAAAAWRLRVEADADVEAFAALLRSAGTDDPYVREVIAGAFEPLTPSELGISVPTATGEEIFRDPLEGFLGDVQVQTTVQTPTGINDPFRGEDPLSSVYDPDSGLSPQAGSLLRLEAGRADSVLPARGWLSPEEAAEIYVGSLETARSLLAESRVMEAHELLDPLLKTDYLNNPEAWHLDALALMDSGSPGGRMFAQERVLKALRLDPGNLRYRLTLAMILSRRTMDVTADQMLDDILEEVPAAADAYALKARMRLETFWALGWRGAGWGTPVFERATDPDVALAEALDLLNRALVVDPGNEMAAWWLGTHFILAKEWREVVPVMTYLIEHDVHKAEALLGRGMALQHLERLELAWRDYLAALELLPETMQRLADDPRWVLPPSQGGTIPVRWSVQISSRRGAGASEAVIEGEARDRYWRAKDPLFSTPVNERAMEQYRRFAYVTWRFAVPNMGLRGWETHRGRVYLRYGEPLEIDSQIEELREKMDPVIVPDAEYLTLHDMASNRLFLPMEVWEYQDMAFTFGGGITSGNMRLWPSGSDDYIDSIEDFKRLAERVPESSKVEGGRTVIGIEATWYCFEGNRGQRELIPVTHLPDFELVGIQPPAGGALIPINFVILDEAWREIESTSQDLRQGGRGGIGSLHWVGDVITLPAGTPAADAAYAAIEIVPSGRRSAFASRDTLEGLPSTGLRTSSLVAATNVQEADRAVSWPVDTYFSRSGQAIVPRPTGRFVLNEPIYFYFEIYGLSKDEIGATRYQIALTVTSLRERGILAPVVDALGRLVGRKAQEGRVTLLFDRGGITGRSKESLRMVFPPDRRADSYLVTVEVIDQVSGERFGRSVAVKIGS